MTKREYERVRNLSWKFLIKNKITGLPVNMDVVLSENRIRHISYQNPISTEIMNSLGILGMMETELAVITKIGTEFIIFYNKNLWPFGRKLFTIAHEIGHVYLNHSIVQNTALGRATHYKAGKPLHETEADMFAARILAPLFVLKECNVKTVEDIVKLTGLTKKAAKNRLARLDEVAPRGKFYTHEYERQLYLQFEDFIKTYNKKR